jgi:hypothetical protein
MALHGHLASPVGRRLAMDAMSDEALVFEDHRQLNQPRTLPLESLWYWLKRRHPRLSTSKLELKFTELCNHFVGNDAPAPSIAVQRAILVDFGKANWTLGEVLSRINFAGTTSEGCYSPTRVVPCRHHDRMHCGMAALSRWESCLARESVRVLTLPPLTHLKWRASGPCKLICSD